MIRNYQVSLRSYRTSVINKYRQGKNSVFYSWLCQCVYPTSNAKDKSAHPDFQNMFNNIVRCPYHMEVVLERITAQTSIQNSVYSNTTLIRWEATDRPDLVFLEGAEQYTVFDTVPGIKIYLLWNEARNSILLLVVGKYTTENIEQMYEWFAEYMYAKCVPETFKEFIPNFKTFITDCEILTPVEDSIQEYIRKFLPHVPERRWLVVEDDRASSYYRQYENYLDKAMNALKEYEKLSIMLEQLTINCTARDDVVYSKDGVRYYYSTVLDIFDPEGAALYDEDTYYYLHKVLNREVEVRVSGEIKYTYDRGGAAEQQQWGNHKLEYGVCAPHMQYNCLGGHATDFKLAVAKRDFDIAHMVLDNIVRQLNINDGTVCRHFADSLEEAAKHNAPIFRIPGTTTWTTWAEVEATLRNAAEQQAQDDTTPTTQEVDVNETA